MRKRMLGKLALEMFFSSGMKKVSASEQKRVASTLRQVASVGVNLSDLDEK